MDKRFWGKADGREVSLISLDNGMIKAEVTNYGAALISLWVPDQNGRRIDVVMGYDTLPEYMGQSCYAGVIAGRCANRIKNSRFVLDGEEFRLDQNEGKNHLHGGLKGFGKVVWDVVSGGSDYVILKYLSGDGECGYPGNLECTVEYRLEDHRITILYRGTTDKDTVMNLTNHSYFNLNGHGGGTIKDHIVSIAAERITELDSESCSTGDFIPVEGTPFDLRKPAKIGSRLTDEHEQMKIGKGFDHNYVLSSSDPALPAADLYSEDSGIGMKVYTDLEGMHFYTGNHLDGKLEGKNGAIYPRFAALCFESQHFPNAVNIGHFPSPVIKKGEVKKSMTSFEFYNR